MPYYFTIVSSQMIWCNDPESCTTDWPAMENYGKGLIFNEVRIAEQANIYKRNENLKIKVNTFMVLFESTSLKQFVKTS